MAGKFKRFRKPLYCKNASSAGFRKYAVSEGDLISYREYYERGTHGVRLARVLGLATHGGDGTKYDKPRLAVLAADDLLTHGYERHVAREDVLEILMRGPDGPPRDFAKFFLFGEMPALEVAYAAGEYGALSDGYIGKYLDAEGKLTTMFARRTMVGR